MKAETLRMERQEEVKRKQEMAKEAEELSVKQRYERLQKLLGKSQFYTDFLLKKMKGHEAAMELKKQTNEARAKKRAEKGENALTDKRRTGRNEEKEEVEEKSTAKRGRKSKGGEEPASKKRKTEDVVDQEEVKKNRNEKDRKFEGREIPSNQPLLLTGGIMRDYQLEGYEWMSLIIPPVSSNGWLLGISLPSNFLSFSFLFFFTSSWTTTSSVFLFLLAGSSPPLLFLPLLAVDFSSISSLSSFLPVLLLSVNAFSPFSALFLALASLVCFLSSIAASWPFIFFSKKSV